MFSIKIPTDEDGFVLLRCPRCEELFKLSTLDLEDESNFNIYCPSCGLVSDSYLTNDVIELAVTMILNEKSDLIGDQLKQLERKQANKMLKIKVKRGTRKNETPLRFTVETLDKVDFLCCKKKAKIKPILHMSGYFCPFCGEIYYGIE